MSARRPDDPFTRRQLRLLVPRIRRLGGAVTAREVARRLWRYRFAGNGILEYLVAYGFGRWEPRPPGPRGGRPTRVFVLNDDDDDSGGGPDETAAAPDETSDTAPGRAG